MEQVYYWIGLTVFWLSALLGSIVTVVYISGLILNRLSDVFNGMWIVIEYAYYRKKFKNWVKDKERHPKVK